MISIPQVVPTAASGCTQSLLEQAFEELSNAGVRWCLLRNEPTGLGDGDLDILVESPDAARAGTVLRAIGFTEFPSLGRGTHRFFVAYDRTARAWRELDMVTELAYGPHFGLRTNVADGCLARRRLLGSAFVLDNDDSFWTLLFHCLLDKRRFRRDHAARLQGLSWEASIAGEFPALIDDLVPGAALAEQLRAAVRRADWPVVAGLGQCLRRAMLTRQRASRSALLLVRVLLRVIEKPLALWHRRGLSVALLGVDGAGKSTVITAIAEDFPLATRSVYMGLWSSRGPLARSRTTRGLRAVVRPGIIWLRYLRGLAHRLLGRLVVYDRYTYDAFLPARPPFRGLKQAYFSVIARSCPAPDLVLLLDVSPNIAASRKPRQDPAVLESDRRALLALRGRLSQLEVVDAGRDPEAMRADITELIWKRYRARWERVA